MGMDRRDRRLVHWSRAALALRSGKRWVRRLERLAAWALDPGAYPRAPISASPDRHDRLWWRGAMATERRGADPRLERGKLQNLGIAAVAIDGRELAPGRGFSFWRLVGRPSVSRGFAVGAEVRAGCVVPTPGGGLCLLSNLLFRAAAELGWEITERSGHTLAWSPADRAPDATVAWPDVDLRFEPGAPCRLAVRLAPGELALEVWGAGPASAGCAVRSESLIAGDRLVVRRLWRERADGSRELLGTDRKRVLPREQRGVNCLSCGEVDCHARPLALDGAR